MPRKSKKVLVISWNIQENRLTKALSFVTIDMTERVAIPENSKKEAVPAGDRGGNSKMKTFARIMALVLACVMCLFVVVACNGNDDNGGTTYDPTKDDYGYLKDDLDKYNLNYTGEVITTLYWSDVEKQEYEADSLTGDNVNDAIYERNQNVQSRLNVELAWQSTPGNVQKRAAFVKKVTDDYSVGNTSYDLISSYSRTEGMLAINGLLIDLKDIAEVGTSYLTAFNTGTDGNVLKPWWPKALVDTVSIGDSVYFLSGDCSTNVLHLMYTMYFNKDLLNRYHNNEAQQDGFEDATAYLYDLVYKGKWTIDKLIELTSGINTSTDGTKDVSQTFGFCTVNYHIDAFYTGSYMRYVEQGKTSSDPLLYISKDYGSKKTVQLVDKLGKWLTSEDCWALGTDSAGTYTTPFKEGRALFCQNRAYFAENSLVNIKGLSYGLVPTPKYDENQKNYYTVEANPFSLYGIYVNAPIRETQAETWSMLSAVLECWCSEAYRLTTPEIFYVNMQLKYSETQDETNMFELVRSAITFDLGRIFTNDLSFMSELPSNCALNGGSWSTSYAAYKKVLNKQIATICEKLQSWGTQS